jgi:hypothetical protein
VFQLNEAEVSMRVPFLIVDVEIDVRLSVAR